MKSTQGMGRKSQINTLKVNGVAKSSRPAKGSLVLGFDEAHKLILATEAATDMPREIREELPAIVTHWLQSPKEKPVLMPVAYRDKWLIILREYCLLQREKSVARPLNRTKSPRPVHIDFSGIPFAPVLKPKFTFIDLFAGIGGFRIAMQGLGGKCLFSSEWEPNAKETYYNNYGEVPFGDITKFTNTGIPGALPSEDIPAHDILCAGFPCQPFSQAGLKRGFEDARGTLFFDILTIAKQRKPKVLLLENVKRLRTHDNGKTIKVIFDSLSQIGYKFNADVLRAYDFGVPQNRERVFIVAFRDFESFGRFEFPGKKPHSIYKNVGDALENAPPSEYTISDKLWAGHQRRLAEHKRKGHGFGYSLFSRKDEYVNTISARYYKDGSEVLISQKGKNPRKLTERECARIQGFPEEFQFHTSKKEAYQQFGNSVAVPVVRALAKSILSSIKK